MKRFIACAGSIVLAAAMLASCSAYNSPEDYITVPELSTITISQAELDKSLKEQIDQIIEDNRKEDYQVVEETAKMGDQVNIDYEGKAADSSVTLTEDTLKGMKAEKADLILGSGSFIGAYSKDGEVVTEGFEEQLVGLKAGDTKDITVTFPDSYSNDTSLQGVKVIFSVTVNSVSRLTVDEKCLAEISYTFTDPAESEKESTPSASSAASDEDGVTDDSLEETEDTVEFSDLFEDGDFEIDYAAETDADEVFNEIFKVADYRDLFVGKHKLDTVEQKVTVPTDVEDDFKAYAGKEITVTFTVESATVLPEWNDEFVKEYTEETYTTVTAYEDALKKDIKSSAAYDAVVAAVTVNELPKKEVDKLYKQYVDQMVAQQVQSLNSQGKKIDEMTQDELDALITEETYNQIYSSAAKQSVEDVKERLIWEYLIKELDVTLTKDEYNEFLEEGYKEYADQYMYYYYSYYGIMFTSAEDMENYYGKDSLELQFKFNKVIELLPDKVTVAE